MHVFLIPAVVFCWKGWRLVADTEAGVYYDEGGPCMQYKSFWEKFRRYVEKEQCSLKFKYDNEKDRWTKLDLGKPGTILELRPVDTKRIILAQIRFTTLETQKIYERFYSESKRDIESEIGSSLIWERNEPGKVTCKINLEAPFDLRDWPWAFNWIIEKANLFMSVFIPRLGGSGVSLSHVNPPMQKREQSQENNSLLAQGEIPTWDEIQAIYKEDAKPGEDIAPDRLKKLIEQLFQHQRRDLLPNWWEETKIIIRNESEKQGHHDK